MTIFYMRFPGHFPQIGFSCYLVWKHSKNTHGTYFWGWWAFFFLKISQMWWILDFLPFWQNMLLVWLTNNNNYSGLFEKGFWRWTSWKIYFFSIFDLFFDLFWRFFCYFKKIWEGVSEKIISGQNLIFHMQKLIRKPKNMPTLFKKPTWNPGNVRKEISSHFLTGFFIQSGYIFWLSYQLLHVKN